MFIRLRDSVKDKALIVLAPVYDAALDFRKQEKLCCTVR